MKTEEINNPIPAKTIDGTYAHTHTHTHTHAPTNTLIELAPKAKSKYPGVIIGH